MRDQDAFRRQIDLIKIAIIEMTKEMNEEEKGRWLQTLYTSYLNRMLSDNERIWRTGALFVPLSLSAFAAYATAGGNLFLCGYNLQDIASSFPSYGIYGAVFGYGAGNYGGMDGVEGTAYADWGIDLPEGYTDRLYQRVYDDAANTQSIFSVRGNDGDSRSCGVRAEMPLGNVVIVIGQSIPFFDPNDPDTKAFGEYVLGTEFGESK